MYVAFVLSMIVILVDFHRPSSVCHFALHSPMAESKDFPDGPLAQPTISSVESNTNVLRYDISIPHFAKPDLNTTIVSLFY